MLGILKKNHGFNLFILLTFLFLLCYSCKKVNKNQNTPHWTIPVTSDLLYMDNWKIASTPLHQTNIEMFPEGTPFTGLDYRKNVARLAWYNIDSIFSLWSPLLPPNISVNELSNHFTRRVIETEIWVNAEPSFKPVYIPILNLAYYPTEKGPYNYDAAATAYNAGIASDGSLMNPSSRWGGITCSIDDHVQQLPSNDSPDAWTIDFILLDPFVNDPNHSGGDLYIHLGLVSEDVLRDGRLSIESGLPSSEQITNIDTTIWGRVTTKWPVSSEFNSSPENRVNQDIGLDGLSNENEQTFFMDNFIQVITDLHGTSSMAYQLAFEDPSTDDFQYFRSSEFDLHNGSILDRYKKINGLEGNSPTIEQTTENYPIAATQTPDREDFSESGVVQQTERYFQYKISLRPKDMIVNQNYIIDIRNASHIHLPNGNIGEVNWYYFSIPIQSSNKEIIGGGPSVSDYRFIRLIYKNFEQSIFSRYAVFQIITNETNRPVFDFNPIPLD
jgi:cell surface protein SprA